MFEGSKSGWLIKFTEELEEVEEEAVVEFDATIVEAEAAIVEFWGGSDAMKKFLHKEFLDWSKI